MLAFDWPYAIFAKPQATPSIKIFLCSLAPISHVSRLCCHHSKPTVYHKLLHCLSKIKEEYIHLHHVQIRAGFYSLHSKNVHIWQVFWSDIIDFLISCTFFFCLQNTEKPHLQVNILDIKFAVNRQALKRLISSHLNFKNIRLRNHLSRTQLKAATQVMKCRLLAHRENKRTPSHVTITMVWNSRQAHIRPRDPLLCQSQHRRLWWDPIVLM